MTCLRSKRSWWRGRMLSGYSSFRWSSSCACQCRAVLLLPAVFQWPLACSRQQIHMLFGLLTDHAVPSLLISPCSLRSLLVHHGISLPLLDQDRADVRALQILDGTQLQGTKLLQTTPQFTSDDQRVIPFKAHKAKLSWPRDLAQYLL